MKTQINKVVRVAVNNNFNCTDAEFQQLDNFAAAYPDTLFFINTNVKTKMLTNINKHPYKAVITLNPDILVNEALVRKLAKIDKKLIAFVRIKYIPGNPEILSLIKTIRKEYPVVITLQRFNSIKSAEEFTPNFRDHYKHSNNRFRLYGNSLKEVEQLTETKNIYICDKAGLGCGGCGLCSKLTTKKDLPIFSLNLSSSGLCPFNCKDCYAKTMQHFLEKIGTNVINFDWIHLNSKQSGRTKHIKANQAKL
jgi:hypothetical protein